MLRKYPHLATIRWFPDPEPDPATGIYSEAGMPIIKQQKCRFDEPNNRIILPKLDYKIPKNAELIINEVKLHIESILVSQKGVMIWV